MKIKLKVPLCLLLIVTIAFPFLPQGVEAEKRLIFKEVPASHWAYDMVKWDFEQGIVNGYSDGTFRPNNVVNLAEFLTFYIRTTNIFSEQNKVDFNSIPLDRDMAWDEQVYRFAKNYNWNISDYRYEPITRGEVAIVLLNSIGFNCSEDSSIQYLLDKGYTKGKIEGTIDGYMKNDTLTRAEAITFISRFISSDQTAQKMVNSNTSQCPVVKGEPLQWVHDIKKKEDFVQPRVKTLHFDESTRKMHVSTIDNILISMEHYAVVDDKLWTLVSWQNNSLKDVTLNISPLSDTIVQILHEKTNEPEPSFPKSTYHFEACERSESISHYDGMYSTSLIITIDQECVERNNIKRAQMEKELNEFNESVQGVFQRGQHRSRRSNVSTVDGELRNYKINAGEFVQFVLSSPIENNQNILQILANYKLGLSQSYELKLNYDVSKPLDMEEYKLMYLMGSNDLLLIH